MAEIGLIASVIGVAGAGIKLSITLYTFSETVATAADSIKSIAKDVSLTSAVLEELGSNLRQDEQARLYSGTALRTAQTVVVDCEAVFKQIDGALSKSMERIGGLASTGKPKGKGGKVVLSAIERLKWPFLQPKMQELRANLERLKSTLVLMLNVLTYARKIHPEKQSQPPKDDYQQLLIENLVAANQEATRNFQTLLRTIGSSDETGCIMTTSTRELSIGESAEMRTSSSLAEETDFKRRRASELSLAEQPRDMPAPNEDSGIGQFMISGTSSATETTMACLKRIQEALDQFEASEDKIASATQMKVSIEVCKHILHSEAGPRVRKPWEVASIVRVSPPAVSKSTPLNPTNDAAARRRANDLATEAAFLAAAAEDAKRDKEKDSKTDKLKASGWFSGWLPGKKGDSLDTGSSGTKEGEKKAIRAKLGDESSFYYDKELKRWINKKDPYSMQAGAKAAPPPPKGPVGVLRGLTPSASLPNLSGRPERTKTPNENGLIAPPAQNGPSRIDLIDPPAGAKPPSGSSTPSIGGSGAGLGPPPRPSTATSTSSIDNLLGPPTAGGRKSVKGKRGGRYIDLLAIASPNTTSGQLRSSRRTAALQDQIGDTIAVMRENLDKVVQRGERIDSLQDKTESLSVSAEKFRTANRARKQQGWPSTLSTAWKYLPSPRAIIVFTVVTIFFLPPSFVTGFFGMNPQGITATTSTVKHFWVIALLLTFGVVLLCLFTAFLGSIKRWTIASADEFLQEKFAAVFYTGGKPEDNIMSTGDNTVPTPGSPRPGGVDYFAISDTHGDKIVPATGIMPIGEKIVRDGIVPSKDIMSTGDKIAPTNKDQVVVTNDLISLGGQGAIDDLISLAERGAIADLMSPGEQGAVADLMSPGERGSIADLMSPGERGSIDDLMSPSERGSIDLMSPSERGSIDLMSPGERGSINLMSPGERGAIDDLMPIDGKIAPTKQVRSEDEAVATNEITSIGDQGIDSIGGTQDLSLEFLLKEWTTLYD